MLIIQPYLSQIYYVTLQEKLSADLQESMLTECPSMLEIAGQAYFFGGFLAGPLVSYRLRVCDCLVKGSKCLCTL